jgi:hypothetical protein
MAILVLNCHRLTGVIYPLVTGRERMISQQPPDSTQDKNAHPNVNADADIFHVNSFPYS